MGKLRRGDAAQNQTVTVNHKKETKFGGAGRYAILHQGLPLERQIVDLTKSWGVVQPQLPLASYSESDNLAGKLPFSLQRP